LNQQLKALHSLAGLPSPAVRPALTMALWHLALGSEAVAGAEL